jgi:hypothetical protein
MATVQALGGGAAGNSGNLSTAQTGTGQSTNIVFRGSSQRAALLKIVTTVGATPTCTYAVEGSADGVTWWSIPIADPATPTTISVATFAITSATTTLKLLVVDQPWAYVRLTYSANTNVTNTADVFTF